MTERKDVTMDREPISAAAQGAGTPAGMLPGTPEPSRRSFLKAAPLGALAAVAGGSEARPEIKPAEAAKPDVKRGYHETEHIRRYYQTAAYW